MVSTRKRRSEPSVTLRMFSGRLFSTCPAGASRSKPNFVAINAFPRNGASASPTISSFSAP